MRYPEEKPVVLDELYSVLRKTVRIVVEDYPPSGGTETHYESSDRNDVEDLRASLLLEVPAEGFHCMCLGSPALRLYGPDRECETLTNHHGLSVRCSLWTSDVEVRDTEKWLSWFDRRGMPGPRQEVEDARRRQETNQKAWAKWVDAMPKALAPVWEGAVNHLWGSLNVAPLGIALANGEPEETRCIRALCEWYGSGTGLWSGYPFYEEAAEKLLLGYSTTSIVEAIQSSTFSPAQMEGAARLFAGSSFREARPDDLKKIPYSLKKLLWDHVKKSKDVDKCARAARAFSI